jgi:hypothetical protein
VASSTVLLAETAQVLELAQMRGGCYRFDVEFVEATAAVAACQG